MKKLILSLALVCCAPAFGQGEQETALDRYVKTPDAAYKWSLVKTIPGDGVTAFVIDMTSQTWLTANEVDRPEWKHWVVVYKPDVVKHTAALLMIGGGSNENPAPAKQEPFNAQIAKKTSSVTVELRMVPNQPLSFFGESRKRTEDSIIAYNWVKHMETGDDKWATRLPMTKAAVRAMDTVTAFMKSEAGGGVTVDKYVVTGGSKRGWTTWTAGIVDQRVVAIMPAVIDLLNMVPSFIHHWRAYGFWAPAVGDYVEHGVMDKVNTPEFSRLMKLVEPYEYRGRLTLPKYIVNSTGDQFFLPDSWQFYWDDLKGEKYLRYVPNTDHGVTRRSDAGDSLATYYASIINNWKRPEFDWSVARDGTITVKSKEKPSAVKLWQAHNPDARDFRLERIGPAYKSTDVAETAPNTWVVKTPAVEKGWVAYFVELTFPAPEGMAWKFTTGVKVMPDAYPFPAPDFAAATK
ncbi:MAG: PhoPQ-activated pathogenicity [Candidatus Solibacter sp.]|nr:PhoPQ-activated pathogenicity [Candidatus Solibacter sp.]